MSRNETPSVLETPSSGAHTACTRLESDLRRHGQDPSHLKGARSRIRSRRPLVFMNEPAQHVATMQSHARSVGFPAGLIRLRGRQAEASVGSRPVVMDGIAAKHTLE